MKQTVVFDFDGVIHSYTSGWQGPGVIPDPPVPGIKKAIEDIRSAGYEVIVVSTRCATTSGHGAVRAWLIDHDIVVDDVKTEKPPAIVYIDDLAICFDGKPETLLNKIKSFNPWYKKTDTNADRIRAMSDEELEDFLIRIEGEQPWSTQFSEKFCDNCPTTTYTVEGSSHPIELSECDFADGKCPHGIDIVWWLRKPAEEG